MSSSMSSVLRCHVIKRRYIFFIFFIFFCSSSSSVIFFSLLREIMNPVIIVSGKWVKKKRHVFVADSRGSRVLHIDEQTTLDDLAKSVVDDYELDESSHEIKMSYMFSNKTLKTLSHDTPPCYVTSTRQLQGFVSLRKIEQLRLCVEITEKKDGDVIQNEGSRENRKRSFSFRSEDERSDVQRGGVEGSEVECTSENYSGGDDVDDVFSLEDEGDENDCCSQVEGEKENVGGEDEEVEQNEEVDEFDSRFDMFDDSDGASSEDDNFSLYGEAQLEDEDSPTLPTKKRTQNWSMSGSNGNPDVRRLDISSLHLAVGQRYDSKADLERRLKLLTVRDEFDFHVDVSKPDLLIVRCWIDGCLWRVRASTQGDSPAFYVRIYDSDHTCSITERHNRSRQATPDILGQLYKDLLGDVGPAVRPKSVGIAINKQFGVKMSYWKSHRTLKYAREMEEGTPEIGYENLPSYLYMIRRANPGTITRLQIDEFGRFMYVFLAFGASISGFPFMRKVVVVDGTFLNGKYKGTLLTALAQDGNFQIFPIAFGVVDTENEDSWTWFFTQLKGLIPDDEGLAIISDRHNAIGKAIGIVYPLASRGICTYHLYKNILGRYRGKDAFRLVKKAARCFRMADFIEIFEEIEAINPELHGYLERADVRLWARVHFPGERYNLMTTNIAESMNRALSNARGLHIVRLLEAVRVMMTRWFVERREDARSQPTTLTRGVEKLLTGRVADARRLTVQRIDDHNTEVTYGSNGESLHVVNLERRKCTCRRFEREKIPCAHAIAAAEHRNVCRISLCSPYYTSAYLVNAYAASVMPVDSAQQVPENVANLPCFPPFIRQQPGRPKKNRMKSALEVALENKRPRKQHTCSRCGQSGHNVKTCPM